MQDDIAASCFGGPVPPPPPPPPQPEKEAGGKRLAASPPQAPEKKHRGAPLEGAVVGGQSGALKRDGGVKEGVREGATKAPAAAPKREILPVWEVYPYLIVGCEPWDADENIREMLRGIHATHGKHGAAGTVFHIYVQ